ncbi:MULTISPECIES: response regulator [Deinococcus]|uniref:DNA-binding response OmpR family regulator n=2 Tax=Deinococcus soli (ex Cha et al. 2016) TaxID=1309411 RepID=A0AAE4BM52_9DEIO|nr:MULTISPECIES: response regulator [Deinococcus]MDK2011940.1 response regulator [Deinococcus sp. 43]MDR6217804.1 DNA-binding response OmpR family regulator [Deinococcus soli (ex Cha et al. 2016)]MDR6328054.1 DNA-binding response OmpR family regulator [Deinococcus soli (ex Cha et al. 2016)]MDR6750906.1 DNA-binding response OmpR family regulator [Deinococcus soli (ex Cha et al. 2016)]
MTRHLPANVTLFGHVPSKHVLIVEDAPGMRLLVRHILQQGGHKPLEADSVDAAFDELSRGPVDVIITDLMLPGRSGLDLLRDLQAVPDAPPVIVLTGSGEEVLREQALGLGARSVLFKPFSRYELLDAVFAAGMGG